MEKTNCKHYDVCGLYADADPEAGLCILHSEDPNKDEEDFAEALRKHREEKGDKFQFFVFPDFRYFRRTRFTGHTNFENATFVGVASFMEASFSALVTFNNTTFSVRLTLTLSISRMQLTF